MKVKISEKVLLGVYILLVLLQIKTTNVKTAYSFTPHESDLQIRRMNLYPPVLARMGYIQEAKKEVQFLRKLENNFFATIDFRGYFPNRLPYVLSPFIFVGLYFFVKERKRWQKTFYVFFLSLAILAVVGPHAKYGPVLLYPFFGFFVFLCAKKVFGGL